jgi:UDP-glucose 4-epimerase
MEKVLVTGVAGMIGSHLLDALLADPSYDVCGIDDLSFGKLENIAHAEGNPRFRFIRGSVTDVTVVRNLAANADIIVHLAAVKKIGEAESAAPTLMVNAKGTENVFEAAREHGCRVVFASTSDVYGMSPDLPLREDGDLLIGPSMIKRWSYAVSKLYGEQLAFSYCKDFHVPTVVLRYFGAFSPRSSFSWSGGHIPIFIRAVLADQDVVIHGDGSQTRSMAYVDDVIDGTVRAMKTGAAYGEIINLGNNEEMSVLDSARLIHRIAATGRELRIRFVPFGDVFGTYKDIMRRLPDLTKAERLLGYRPRITTEQAVRLTIDAVRSVQARV